MDIPEGETIVNENDYSTLTILKSFSGDGVILTRYYASPLGNYIYNTEKVFTLSNAEIKALGECELIGEGF